METTTPLPFSWPRPIWGEQQEEVNHCIMHPIFYKATGPLYKCLFNGLYGNDHLSRRRAEKVFLGVLPVVYIWDWSGGCGALQLSSGSFGNPVTLHDLDEPVVGFRTTKSRPALSSCFPSRCWFHCLFSHSPAVFQLIPHQPRQGRQRGQPGPPWHSGPDTEPQPAGSQVELGLLDVLQAPEPDPNPFFSHSEKQK